MFFKYKKFSIKKTIKSYGLYYNSLLVFESDDISKMFIYIEQFERNEKLAELTKFLFLNI